MAIEITVPRLGWSMEEGVLTEWLKREGEQVNKGDLLFVLEGDKAAQEIESFDEGILKFLPEGPRPGDTVKVGQVIGLLLAENESVVEHTAPKPIAQKRSGIAPPASPSARRQARRQRAMAESASPAVAAPVVTTVAKAVGAGSRPKSSPRARRKAAELGVDWKVLQGSGKTGRIIERDVVVAANGMPAAKSPIKSSDPLVPHSATRRTIAARMHESHQTTAPVTLTTTADATNLVNLRQQFKTQTTPDSPSPGYSDLIAKLTTAVIVEFPYMNARWDDAGSVQYSDVHLGIAVDTEVGLMVPVVRAAQRLSLREFATQSKDLIARANARRLKAEEMQGGTFTISNLGAYGIDAFTPIINGPQCAILGLGRIRQVPTCVGGQVVPRDQITLSLTFDHRLVDGGPAARFLQAVAQAIENPAARLIA